MNNALNYMSWISILQLKIAQQKLSLQIERGLTSLWVTHNGSVIIRLPQSAPPWKNPKKDSEIIYGQSKRAQRKWNKEDGRC
jgi:hypothetical protein